MKSVEEIKAHLDSLKSVFGFNPNEIQQGSEEWLQMKLGVISASNSHRLMSGSKSTFIGYVNELVAEITTKEKPQINARQLEWGKMHEIAAQSAFEFETGVNIVSLPFIFMDKTLRVGCSPDAYGQKGAEIKCPYNSTVFIEFVCDKKIKPEYINQCQHSMMTTDANEWLFINYDPRQTVKQFHSLVIERDEKYIKKLRERCDDAIFETDLRLAKLGVQFGHQWK